MLTNSSNFYLRARTSWDLLKKPMSGACLNKKARNLVKTRKSVRNCKKSMTSLWILLQSTPMLIQIKSSMLISVTISTLFVVAIKNNTKEKQARSGRWGKVAFFWRSPSQIDEGLECKAKFWSSKKSRNGNKHDIGK